MVIKLYTIENCQACAAYTNLLHRLCVAYGIVLEKYDIDTDPIFSVSILKSHATCAESIPFFVIYKDGEQLNCYSGIHEESTLSLILEKHLFIYK
jgi:thioredoxin-like negative regulator of GroEL